MVLPDPLRPRQAGRPHSAITAQAGIDWQACVQGLTAVSPRLGSWAQAAARQTRAALAAIGAGELPVTVIHGDFAEWNVHYQRGRLAGVIDFGLTRLDSRPCEEAAIRPLYHAFRLDLAAWELDRALKTGEYRLPAIERQLSRTGTPLP